MQIMKSQVKVAFTVHVTHDVTVSVHAWRGLGKKGSRMNRDRTLEEVALTHSRMGSNDGGCVWASGGQRREKVNGQVTDDYIHRAKRTPRAREQRETSQRTNKNAGMLRT